MTLTIGGELIDEVLNDYDTRQEILGEGGLLKELTTAVIERVSRKRNWSTIWAMPDMAGRATPQAIRAMGRARKR